MKKMMPALVVLTALVSSADPGEKSNTRIEFRIGESRPGAGLAEMRIPGRDTNVYVHKEVVLSDRDIAAAKARAAEISPGALRPQIDIVFTEKGKEKFARVTAAALGKHLAILLDGKLVSAPVVREQITGGQAVIVGSFTMAEAKRIAREINTGQPGCGKGTPELGDAAANQEPPAEIRP